MLALTLPSFTFDELLVLLLVFSAVFWCVWMVTPLLTQVGFERSAGKYVATEARLEPIYRFTTPQRLLQACWSSAVLAAGIIASALISFNVLNKYILFPAVLVAGFAAYRVPKKWLDRKIKQRRLAFEARLVDLTLGLANGLRAGAALPQSLEIVAMDMGGPMQEEMNFLLHEYRLGVDLPEALVRLTERMPSEDLYLLATSVRLTMQSGGSLAEVLDRITDTIRERTVFQQKLLTLTSQGRFEAIAMASAPAVAFLLMLFLDPELMMPMLTSTIGWIGIGAILTLEIIGFLIIKKIVTIEV